jgi:LysR family transcriptional regulator, glycine cleavage system transcriptional activator
MRLPAFKSLKTFQVAARTLSFKMAADELFLTASAVSHQIKALEREVGVRLFERGVRSLRLSDAGTLYLAHVDEMFGRLESVTQQLRERFGRGILRLHAPSFFAHELLLPRLADFSQSRPDTDIRIDTAAGPGSLHSPEADLSIVVGSGPWEDVCVHPLFEQRFIAACAPALLAQGDISSMRDLAYHTLLVLEERRDVWQRWAAEQGFDSLRPARLVRLDDMAAVVRAAEQGVGIGLIPAHLSAQRFASGSLVRLFDTEFATHEQYVLLHRREDESRPGVRELTQWIVSLCRQT